MMKQVVQLLGLSVLLSGMLLADEIVVAGNAGISVVVDKPDVTVQADGTPMSMESGSSATEVAKKLANPVAAMISLPIQPNYQPNLGLNDEGGQWLINVQPVVPIDLNDEWNIISRTIVPIISKDTGIPGADKINGLSDIVQSAWLSPKAPTESGWIWGAGAAFLIPSATDDALGADRWGAGPTGLALRQDGPWTYGGLFNHIWSFAGSDRFDAEGNVANNVNQTFMQPFLTYITPESVTFALNTETQYDWEREQWTVPINFVVTKVMKFGNQMVSLGGGVTYWAEAPDAGPEGFGVRLLAVFIFPK